MKDRNQDIGWLILFFITSGFTGFIVSSWIIKDDIRSRIIIGSILMIITFFICILFYYKLRFSNQKEQFRALLTRGHFEEVYNQIDNNDKAMKDLWEIKMLAAFHTGAILEFKQLYQNYMNEINEPINLDRYMIAILHDLLIASESDKKPVSFMKDIEPSSSKYRKSIPFQLLRNLRMGLQEFYKPQKNLVKVYFDKYLLQVDTISKPLQFYIYFVMVCAMIEEDHPQVDAYVSKTVQSAFDTNSYQQVEQLQKYMFQTKKGNRYQGDMNTKFNRRDISNEQDVTQDNLQRTFDYHQPSFRRQRNEEAQTFTPRHQAQEFQNEFDSMHASIGEETPYSLYEDMPMEELNTTRATQESIQKPSLDMDNNLDPTWFARRSNEQMEQPQSSVAFQQEQMPRMNRRVDTGNVQPVDTFNQMKGMQDTYEDANRFDRRREAPTFVNQRSTPINTPVPPTSATQNPMAQPVNDQSNYSTMRRDDYAQRMRTTQAQSGFQNNQDIQQPLDTQQTRAPFQQRTTNVAQSTTRHQSQRPPIDSDQRFSHFQQQTSAQQVTQSKLEASTQSKESAKAKRFHRKKKQSDPFDFDSTNVQVNKATQTKQAQSVEQEKKKHVSTYTAQDTNTQYRTYIKHNTIVFILTLLNAAIISLASSSFVYTAFFNKFSSVTSQIIPEIIQMAVILALLITYVTAGIHTGFTIMKKTTQKWSGVVKVISFPFMLVIYACIGAICEIPYFIFASIKASKEA